MADDHFMLTEGRLNDGPIDLFFVDSGLAGGAFTCPASMLEAAGIVRGSTGIAEGKGGGGAMKVWPFDVAALSLGVAPFLGAVVKAPAAPRRSPINGAKTERTWPMAPVLTGRRAIC